MARRANLDIRQVAYQQGGALVTIFVPKASPSDAPSILFSGLGKAKAGRPRGKRNGNKAADVLAAVKAGAKHPAEIAEKSGVDKKQVHAYLAYHKRRGVMTGNAAKGFIAK